VSSHDVSFLFVRFLGMKKTNKVLCDPATVLISFSLVDEDVVLLRDDHYPFAGSISGKIVSLQPDTDIRKLL